VKTNTNPNHMARATMEPETAFAGGGSGAWRSRIGVLVVAGEAFAVELIGRSLTRSR